MFAICQVFDKNQRFYRNNIRLFSPAKRKKTPKNGLQSPQIIVFLTAN